MSEAWLTRTHHTGQVVRVQKVQSEQVYLGRGIQLGLLVPTDWAYG